MKHRDDNNNAHHRRRSLRRRGYDYAQAAAYFVTICTQQRIACFGQVIEGAMCLSPAGQMVQETWYALPQHYVGFDLDAFVVMPDHVHGIVLIRGEQNGLALPDVMQRFKSLTTARYRHQVVLNGWAPFPGKLWQRSYYERIIHDEIALNRVRAYIAANPMRWHGTRL